MNNKLIINTLKKEIWKVIEDFPDYQVSNFGGIKSFKYDREETLKQYKNNRDYFVVYLYKNKRKTTQQVHRLIFETFNNYKLKKDECVHHINGDKENNNLENLKLMPKSEHSSFHNNGEKHPLFGKHHSKETKKKISKKMKDENHPLFGKYHSEETKNKMSETRKEKFKNNKLDQKGEKNSNSKLTKQQVDEIKLLKLSQRQIAKIFGISQAMVSSIKTGKSWL